MSTALHPRSLRFRLTALATLVVAVVVAITAVVLLAVQRQQLTATLDASLEQRAETIGSQLTDQLPYQPLPTNDEDRAFQVVGDDGSIVAVSRNLSGAAALPDSLRPDQRQQVSTRRDLPIEDDSYRVLTRRIDLPSGRAVLHVAENSDDLSEAIANLTVALALTLPAVVALLAGLMWWVTGRTLRPVETIRAEVDAISATHSSQRVHVPTRTDEIARLATTMNRMLDRLDETADRQRRFVADAAHELRTPITRIRADVEVDLAQPERADSTATNRAVRHESIALDRLIDDLLQLARSDAGHSVPHRPLDLDDVVLAEVRRQRHASDGIAISAGGVSAAHALGDPDQLARAVRNVLSNAVRHARSTVTVTLTEDGDLIELAIADDGPGVAEEHHERIFDRFARVDDARARADGGTGLGLAIAKEVVERHGGTIGYDPGFSGGARFVIRLPVHQAGGAIQPPA